jgi:hypothetical protein
MPNRSVMRVDGTSQAATHVSSTLKFLVVTVDIVAIGKPKCATSSIVVPVVLHIAALRVTHHVPDRSSSVFAVYQRRY